MRRCDPEGTGAKSDCSNAKKELKKAIYTGYGLSFSTLRKHLHAPRWSRIGWRISWIPLVLARWTPVDNIPLFGEYQLLKAADSLWNEKEPNRDGIPAELMKVVAHPYFKLLLNMLICCLSEVVFYRRRILRQ